jgi:hypothetical protein
MDTETDCTQACVTSFIGLAIESYGAPAAAPTSSTVTARNVIGRIDRCAHANVLVIMVVGGVSFSAQLARYNCLIRWCNK